MTAIENFIQQIVSTGSEIIDKPGFIICKVTNSNKPMYLRELILPEDLFIKLELAVKEKFGENGLTALYAAGKNFGYNYSKISDFTKYEKTNEKEFVEFFEFFMNYMKSWWLSDYTYRFDFEKKKAEIEFSNYLICRKSGVGKIIKEGCMAGFFAFLFNDKTIEAKQIECQGRGAKKCKTIYSPTENLNEKQETKIKEKEYNAQTYNQINETKPLNYSKLSLKDLMYSKTLKYEQGILTANGLRHFLIGSDFIYDLEDEMKKLDGGQTLYYAAKEFGQKIVKQDNLEITAYFELLSAFGWGDFSITSENGEQSIVLTHYPWFKEIKNHDGIIISGILSGIISKIKGINLNLKVVKKDITDQLYLVLRENND
ncbi:MAG: hypothetical protein ABH873_04440 [Candidatus Firestonebacteria bacterium]